MRGASLSWYEGVFCSGSSFTEGQGLEEKPWRLLGATEALGGCGPPPGAGSERVCVHTGEHM